MKCHFRREKLLQCEMVGLSLTQPDLWYLDKMPVSALKMEPISPANQFGVMLLDLWTEE